MEPLDPRVMHGKEDKELQFARFLMVQTLKDVFDICHWLKTGEYKDRYKYQFGFTEKTQQRGHRIRCFRLKATELQTWINTPVFARLCHHLGWDAAAVRRILEDAFVGVGLEKIGALLDQYKEDLELYAFRGPEGEQRSRFA